MKPHHLLINSLLLISAGTVMADSVATAHQAPRNFVQTAKAVTFKTGKSGQVEMTLHGVSGKTLWFSDRPMRKACTYTTQYFVKNWYTPAQSGFNNDSPNATLTANARDDDAGDTVMSVMQLSNPQYSVAKLTLSYTISRIFHHGKQAKTLHNASLFIDVCFPPFGGC